MLDGEQSSVTPMSEFENQIAGALRSSDHVKTTLLEEMRSGEDFSQWIFEKIKEEREFQEELRKAEKAQRPKITEKAFWKQSKVFGPSVGGLLTILAITGLTWSEIFQPRAIVHGLVGTDARVVDVVTGKSSEELGNDIKDLIDDRLLALLTESSNENTVKDIKGAIRKAVTERPFLVFHGWRPMELVPDDPEFSEVCVQQNAQIDAEREQLLTTLQESNRQLSSAQDDGEKWIAMNAKLQTEAQLSKISDEQEEILKECIFELDDPEVSFSFYADLSRDSVRVVLRVLKYTDGVGLHAVNRQESGALNAALTSVSLNNPEGPVASADVSLNFVEDGLLEAVLTDENTSVVANKNDPIYHLIVRLDREKMGDEIDGLSFVVGSVVQLNKEQPD